MVAFDALVLAFALCGAGDTVLLDFSADWCGPCRMMDPTVRRLVSAGYPVRQINIDREPQVAAQYRVTGVPCFVMLSAGQEVDRIVGAASFARLEQMFTAARRVASGASGATPDQPPPARVELIRSVSGPVPPTSSPVPGSVEAGPSFGRSELSSVAAGPMKERALQASVRIRIEDAKGQSVGSGTLIDRHGAEFLIVTCGHIFRDSAGKGRVLVDLFAQGTATTVEGQVISYDLRRDIGLVSIVASANVSTMPVAPAGFAICRGAPVFSVGCDRGGEARLVDSHVTAIDRYLGTPNIEVAGQPVDGRSGGGLFSSEGYLIGVCNAADPSDNEGIFASLPAIHWELDRIGQQRIYQLSAPNQALAAQTSRGEPNTAGNSDSSLAPPPASVAAVTETDLQHAAWDDAEIICIVRSRSRPQGQEQLFVLDRPSREFLDRLTKESRSQRSAGDIARLPANLDGRSSIRPLPQPLDSDKTVRGQSADH